MKLASTFTVPLKINISEQKHAIKKDGYVNITFKARLHQRQHAKVFFYISVHAFWLAVKHLFKRSDPE